MKRVLLFLSLALFAVEAWAQAPVPAHLMQQRGVTRVQALPVPLPSFSSVAADTAPAAGKRGTAITQSLRMDLFSDVSLVVNLDHVEQQDRNTMAWTGTVDGSPYGSATFVQTGNMLTGSVNRGDGKVYEVRTEPDGTRWVVEIDQSQFPNDEADALPQPAPVSEKDAPQVNNAVALQDDGSTIDVMVLYTAAARIAAGGTTQMQALIQLGIAETNTSYANSGITQRVNLVHTEEVGYVESTAGIQTDLGRLGNLTDGYLDSEAATLRNQYAADLVSLWVSTNENTCGIGYLLNSVSFTPTQLSVYGFSVAELSCATGYYTFGHEMGHNMGANHAKDDPDNPVGVYSYSNGYKQTTGSDRFRTVMAYDCTPSCTRIQYWSNPNVLYHGLPTGIDPQSSLAASNALTLNNTRTIVANFRSSTGGTTTDTTGPTLTITSHTNGQIVTTSSITLSGTATDSGRGDNGISSVTVNGVHATGETASGSGTASWSRTLSLSTGANTITVVAADNSTSGANTTTSTITINRSAAGTSVTSSTYHVFPQFADGKLSDGTSYRTTLMISNPSSTTGANCTLQLHGFSVPNYVLLYNMAPNDWRINQTPGTQAFQSGYATLTCSINVEAQLLYSFYAANGSKISEATVFSSPPSSSVKVIADEREGAQLGLAIANDSDQIATYTITITTSTGSSTTGNVTVAARSTAAKFINQFVTNAPANSLSQVRVSSSTGTASVVGLRYTGNIFTTIPESFSGAADASASTYHVFPRFADGKLSDGSYYKTTRMYLNPNASGTTTCTTTLRGMTTDGFSGYSGSPSAGSFILSTTSGTQNFQGGYATMQCSPDVVNALALYSFYSANGVKLAEATVFSSPSAPMVQILSDSREGAQVGLAIANDTDQSNIYSISAYDLNGALVAFSSLTLAARTADAKFVNQYMPQLSSNFIGQVVVSSVTTGGTASIVGLRFTGSAFTTIPGTIRN